MPHDRHDTLSQLNQVSLSKVKYLSEVDAALSQDLGQARREVQLMYGEMAQFQQHVEKTCDEDVRVECE